MKIVTLKLDKVSGTISLMDGKVDQHCPFKNSFPTQAQMGGIAILS